MPRVIWPRQAARRSLGRTTSSKLLENSWPRELRGAHARAADATPESLRNEMQVGRLAFTRRTPISRHDPTAPEAGVRADNATDPKNAGRTTLDDYIGVGRRSMLKGAKQRRPVRLMETLGGRSERDRARRDGP